MYYKNATNHKTNEELNHNPSLGLWEIKNRCKPVVARVAAVFDFIDLWSRFRAFQVGVWGWHLVASRSAYAGRYQDLEAY